MLVVASTGQCASCFPLSLCHSFSLGFIFCARPCLHMFVSGVHTCPMFRRSPERNACLHLHSLSYTHFHLFYSFVRYRCTFFTYLCIYISDKYIYISACVPLPFGTSFIFARLRTCKLVSARLQTAVGAVPFGASFIFTCLHKLVWTSMQLCVFANKGTIFDSHTAPSEPD